MKLIHFMLIGLMSLGVAFSASAGSVTDTDTDMVPDPFDNCSTIANGPTDPSNQIDTDNDGIGNRCDPDYNNDGAVTSADFGIFVGSFNAVDANVDITGDDAVTSADFGIFVSFFNDVPGPSGLACAGTIPCNP